MEDFWHPHNSIAHLAKRLWVQGFLAGVGVVLVISFIWLSVRGVHAPPSPNDIPGTFPHAPPTQPSQNSPISTVPPPIETPQQLSGLAAVLKTQMEKVLERVKEANQKKDLDQLLTLYSLNFPELSRKAQHFSRTWVTCNYPKMEFLINEVKPLPDGRVFARVTWDIRVEDVQTKNSKELTKTYLVWFVRESGEWRIQALKKAG
ncbi:MAG: hypothetical protein ACOZFS_04580 [Thermodesulfobacteriota bacterium]